MTTSAKRKHRQFPGKSADSIHQITYQQKSEGSDCGKNLAFRKRREEQSHSQAGTSKQKTKQCHVSRCKSNASVLCHDQRIETQDHDRKKKSDDQCQVFSKLTICHTVTGAVRSSWSVFCLRSSLQAFAWQGSVTRSETER